MDEKKKMHLTYDSDNLAVPEVHTNEAEDESADTEENSEIQYDVLAVPEIHIRNRKKCDQ
ncbi:MAG: hypothetical protein MJ095_03400 [Oscillospiraceae bacterium]|nr:hypothetical protein [Oscillospiraceae bacterium]